jgi:antitoxin FitA
MGDMLIRGIPEALKHDIQQAAQKDGQSLSAKAIELLQRAVVVEKHEPKGSRDNAWEELRSVFEDTGIVGDEYVAVMNEVEAERKRDFGRPPPDLE